MPPVPERLPESVYRRRRLTAAAGALGVGALIAVAASGLVGGGSEQPAGAQTTTTQPPAPPPPELPRGGRRVLPDFRVVAYYGAPQHDELGVLGIGSPASAARKLERQARAYAKKTRPVLPALELITVLVQGAAGNDGKYRMRQSNAVIRRYLRAARRQKALLLLDVQPGRSDFFTETTRLERWLKEPDVGLALDPEWRMGPDQLPGKVIGSVAAREVNAVSAWLDQLTARERLPQKLFLVHLFTDDMVRDKQQLKPRANLAMVMNVDGFGGREIKIAKYDHFADAVPRGFDTGFKLFFREDTDLLRPRQVLALRPPPDVVVYE